MDEILTRWASELGDFQTKFQQQAGRVAEWDRSLADNTERVAKLYSATFQAERDAAEVERQLAHLESQQEELSGWLTRYEKEVDKIREDGALPPLGGPGGGGGVGGSSSGGGASGDGGPDSERERTYGLAETLVRRVDRLNGDLAEVIGEINGVSAMLSKATGPDDPLTQVVRILNEHLHLLQDIDLGAAALEERLAAAGRAGSGAAAVPAGAGAGAGAGAAAGPGTPRRRGSTRDRGDGFMASYLRR